MGRTAKYRAKKFGLPFDLSPADVYIPKYCPLLGIRLFRAGGRATDNSPSIDQIVPGKGYTRDNVWVISNRANKIKNNSTPEELIQIGKELIRYYPDLLTYAPNQIQNKPSQETI